MKSARFTLTLILSALLFPVLIPTLTAGDLPKVKVENIRRVHWNGEHNAFTDLIQWNGKYYLTFRSCPDGHMVHSTSRIFILSSDDAQEWKKVYEFHVDLRDVRDPHFLAFQNKLFVYTGAWWCGETKSPKTRDINDHLGYGVWTEDGKNWSEPVVLEGTYGHYIWRAATYDGKAYLIGRRTSGFVQTKSRSERDAILEAALLTSDDGLIFKHHGLFRKTYGDETAFLFEPDGKALAIGRSGGGRNAVVMRSEPPFQQWSKVELDRYIGGPLVAKWGDDYLVAGRKTMDGKARTTFYWLKDDQLYEFAELPSDGDNSYPGFIELGPNKGLISWYSSHEKDDNGNTITAIYLADLVKE